MNLYEEAARILAAAKNAVAFTGAGISAESGIPTFRDPGGLWDQFDAAEVGTVQGLMSLAQRKPHVIREFLLGTVNTFESSKPNAAHLALAELEELGILSSVITQNVDSLHFDAGSKTVYELHGSLFRARCTRCGRRYQLNKADFLKKARFVLEDEKNFSIDKVLTILPPCECGGLTRPDVVMFGEAVQQMNQSFRAAAASDVMLVLGTSGVVYPAAAVPGQAKEAGAKIVEINPHENSYRGISDLYIDEPSAQAMPKVMEQVRKIIAH